METGLAGPMAIICASSRGLGRACAEALVAEGSDVVINGRTEETVTSTASEIRCAFPKVTVTEVS